MPCAGRRPRAAAAVYGLVSDAAKIARGVASRGLDGWVDRFDRCAIHAAVAAALASLVAGAAAA